MIVFVHRFAVRVPRSGRNPHPVAGPQNRFERGDESAGWHQCLHRLPFVDLHEWLTIRNHKQRPLLRFAPYAHAQPLGRPIRFAGFAQTRFLLGRGPRVGQASRQIHHFAGERRQKTFLRFGRPWWHPAPPDVFHPLRRSRNGQNDAPADDQHGDQNDQQNFRDHVPKRRPPHVRTLRFDVLRVVKYRQESGHRAVIVQRQVIHVHRLRTQIYELTQTIGVRRHLLHRHGRRIEFGFQARTFRQHLAVTVVHHHPGQLLPVAESLHNMPQLLSRSFLQRRLYNFLQTLRENFRAPHQIRSQAALLRAHFVLRHDERDDRDARHQK